MQQDSKITRLLVLFTKIFLIGLLLQFFVQTFVNFGLGRNNWFWSFIWSWKELAVIGLFGFLGRTIYKTHDIEALIGKLGLKKYTRVFIGVVLLVLIASVFITKVGLGAAIISLRYSMIGFLIFFLFFLLGVLMFQNQEEGIIQWYSKVIKRLLVGSLFWWGVIWAVPRLLTFVGYDQYSYEGKVGMAPPTTYYTQYNEGYSRNQFLFERPISWGFFLVALWPLFFVLCIKNRGLKNFFGWGGLYAIAVLSTFSRAARIARILQTIFMLFLQNKQLIKKNAIVTFVGLGVVFGLVTYLGKDQIINRQFSNTGHFTSIKTALEKIKEKPIFGQGAGFAGPASHQLQDAKEYNPENQFLQILLEYGIVGFVGWMFLYGYLIYIGFQAYKVSLQGHISKMQKYHSYLVIACSLGLVGLSIEGLVLHSFVDRMIVYPFMALFGLSYAIYFKTKGNFKH